MTMILSMNGNELSAGLPGCDSGSDSALYAAREWADRLHELIHLVDDDGDWLVFPKNVDGTYKLAAPITWKKDEWDAATMCTVAAAEKELEVQRKLNQTG